MLLQSTESFSLRNRWSWFWLLAVPYAISYSWLGLGTILVPIVIFMAPLGFVKICGNPIEYWPIVLLSHLAFWPSYLYALIGAKSTKISTLRICFVALAAIIVCTCYGCATYHVSPLKNWRGITTFDHAPVPDAIRQDALAYFQTMPPGERPPTDDLGMVTYLEDGTGQHAVVVDAPRDGERWQYALIYDRNNWRVKVLRYSVGSYQS